MDRARRSRAACTRRRRVSDTNPVGSAPEVRCRPRCSTAYGACPDIARDGLVASNVLCPPSFAPEHSHPGIPDRESRTCSNTLRLRLCRAGRAALVETLRFQEGRNLPCQAYRSYSTPLLSTAVLRLRYNRTLKLAIIGYGNVGRALVRLVRQKRQEFPFTITGVHTLRHGTAVDAAGLSAEALEAARFGSRAASVEGVLDAARAQVAIELTTLNPSTGEPATEHIRAAMARHMHVVTANKGPIAHAYGALRDEAARQGVGLRFESSVMDGAPVFNLWRHAMPGVKVLGFTG